MIKVPSSYKEWRATLQFDEVEIGIGGVRLATLDELEDFQVGYSVSSDGTSLCSDQPGDWQTHWLAIGDDPGLGDPIILDASADPARILTAMHGMGEWDAVAISLSLEGFAVALAELRKLSKGREYPVALARHPISASEHTSALARIEAANPGVHMHFWELLMENDGE